MSKVQLTDNMVRRGMVRNIGVTVYQLSLLGTKMRKGWRNDLIGKMVPIQNYKLYLALKGVKSKVMRAQIISQFDDIKYTTKAAKKMQADKERYSQQLKSKEWRCKRQVILARDKYRCTECSKGHDLEVHHTYYYTIKSEPWAYPDESLITLCHKCHEQWHASNNNKFMDIKKQDKIMRLADNDEFKNT